MYSAYKLPASCLLLVAAAFLAFGAVIPGEFVVDDLLWAAPQSSSPDAAAEILRVFGTWVFRPLHVLFAKAALALLGHNAAALHGLSIALHGVNSVLLFLLLGRLLPQLALPLRLVPALLFLAQPAGCEAVFWISAMAELTGMLAMLAALLFYLDWRDAWSAARIAAIGALFFAACLFKETAIMLAPLVLAYEFAQDGGKRRLPARLVAVCVLAPVLFLVIRQAMLGSFTGGQQLAISPVRIVELTLAHLRFIWLPAAPPFALRPPEVALASPASVTAALALVALALWSAWRLKANRAVVAFGLAWMALALWPAVAVAAVGEGFFNGRQAYIACAGLPIILAALLERLSLPAARLALAAMAAALAWMFYATVSNAAVWRSNLEVYRQATAVSPGADGPRVGIANALLARGDNEGALAAYAEALSRTASRKDRAAYLYTMASILGQSGRNAESEKLLRQLIELDPANSSAWTGLGNNAWVGARIDEAASHYRRAIELDPDNLEAVSNLASMLADAGPAYAAEAATWRSRAQAQSRRVLQSRGRF